MDNDKKIIFILDDNEDITTTLQEIIVKKIPDVVVYSFNRCNNMIEHCMVNKADLFIIDIELNAELKGNQVADELFKNEFNIPYLFMSGKNYEYECFENYDYTYDFILKPFDSNKLINRIKVLLKVSNVYIKHKEEKEKLQINLKEVFDYTNIYMLILDCKMNIKLCSYKLAKDLGFKTEEELIGTSWKQFIKEKDKVKIDIVHKNVVEDTEKYQKFLREVTNKIVTKEGSTITTKWFNSRIQNGNTYTFSIGIPYNRKVTPADDIESIRSYWKHVLDRDETTLKALKNVV